MAPLDWITSELQLLENKGLRRRRRELIPLADGSCLSDGRQLWNFAANDYLGLAAEPLLIQAAMDASQQGGLGARASPLVTGRTQWHVQLEQRLAELKQAEAAILFPSGYAANLGTIPALVGHEDAVFCDRLNHASLIDGCRLSGARLRVFPHCDTHALRRELEKSTHYRRRLIVTDSLFSMDGDHAPLCELTSLAEEFDSLLMVDEAHATGIYGPRGSGLLEENGIQSERVISMGTLSKAIGVQGGFVTGSQTLIDWLWNVARPQVFSTGLPVPVCAAAIAAIDLIQQEPGRRHQLLSTSERIKTALRKQGWQIPAVTQGPIIPIVIGNADQTVRLGAELEQHSILVASIRPPTVPKGTARLRISLSAAHNDSALNALIEALAQITRPTSS